MSQPLRRTAIREGNQPIGLGDCAEFMPEDVLRIPASLAARVPALGVFSADNFAAIVQSEEWDAQDLLKRAEVCLERLGMPGDDPRRQRAFAAACLLATRYTNLLYGRWLYVRRGIVDRLRPAPDRRNHAGHCRVPGDVVLEAPPDAGVPVGGRPRSAVPAQRESGCRCGGQARRRNRRLGGPRTGRLGRSLAAAGRRPGYSYRGRVRALGRSGRRFHARGLGRIGQDGHLFRSVAAQRVGQNLAGN